MSTNEANRLIHEKSPYLLQHAYNPVDWYPWCDEAFEKARAEDKPVFLSIGYSTCHWCHVMAHESFEDEEVAEVLNRDYVAIKVDREERPDVDSVYMSVCQALTGHGGWPLTIIMTPDQKPFFAGTYLPKESKHGMRGLLDLLSAVADRWENDRASLIKSGNSIVNFVREQEDRYGEGGIDRRTFERAAKTFSQSFDRKYGGFGGAPKFPTPHNLMFLMRYSLLENDGRALEMAEKTLESMYRGGIFDHIGHGFARYSTDDRWLVPHFEKMLYDNALLVLTYLEAYQLTGRELYRNVAEKTLGYVVREMTSPEGGFYSAQDADSEGEEGRYYLLSPGEVENAIGTEAGRKFNSRFDITGKGNFEGLNIPNLIENPDYEEHDHEAEKALDTLREYRRSRYRLHKDDKILTSWNALMIAAFAKAHQATCDIAYLDKAEKAVRFIEENVADGDGTLYVGYRNGRIGIPGFLDDYAFMAWAYLALYEATFEEKYLEKCIRVSGKMSDLFEDTENGGFFLYGEKGEALITRPKETYDGAMPSGNSVAGYVLRRLAELTGNIAIMERAERQMSFLGAAASDYPSSKTFALIAAMSGVYESAQLVCVLPDSEKIVGLKKSLSGKFCPNTTILAKTPRNEKTLSQIAEFTGELVARDGKPTYYLCRNRSCTAPVHSLEMVLRELK